MPASPRRSASAEATLGEPDEDRTTTWVPERTADEPAGLVRLALLPTGPARYGEVGKIGSGGMGEVVRVRDGQLNRLLAMKVIRADRARDPENLARFVEEAQATAQLQHPGIVPVHELGVLEDGRPFFTMREVRGRTFREVFDDWRTGERGAWSLHRVIAAFHQACETVSYAHHRGVIHRDLKPENVLVGEFGEVWVVDWGLAKIVDALDAPTEDRPAIETERTESDTFSTQVGQVAGTPRYMAPEQWSGDVVAMGPATDVFALGAVLCEVLTGNPKPGSIVACAAPELLAIGRKARSRAIADRFPDAGALADEIAAWLDGESRTAEALALVDEALGHEARVVELAARVRALRDDAERLADATPPQAPIDEKRRVWEIEDAAAAVELERTLAEVEQVQLLRAALARAPDLREARQGLADHHQRLHADAERARDTAEMTRQEALLRAYDTGRWAAWLAGVGAVTVHTDPPGAEVDACRYTLRDRQLVPVFDRFLGRTPIDAAVLPIGSWLLRIRAPGRPEVAYPVRIDRERHWDGVPPGGSAPLPIPIPAALAPTEVYVPPGWTIQGGDDGSIGSIPRRRVWVDGFAIHRLAVPVPEWCAYLDAIRERADGEGDSGDPYQRVDGRWTAGPPWHADRPASYVSWREAAAYADWVAARTGVPWRLPTEAEWEKAARGVDERVFPWGDHLDPIFACFMSSHGQGDLLPPALDAYPTDVSPYGVRGLGGTITDWVGDAYLRFGAPVVDGRPQVDLADRDPDLPRVQRGGNWGMHQRLVRSATRWWQGPTYRSGMTGVRLARSL